MIGVDGERRRLAAYLLLLLGAGGVVLALWVVARRAAPVSRPTTTAERPTTTRPSGLRPPLFAANSVWNAPLPANAPVDPASPDLVAQLLREIQAERQAGTGPWIATALSSTPLYVVGPGEPRVPVRLEAKGIPGEPALARALRSVPIPPDARPAAGRDGHMAIWQPSTDTMWELWKAERRSDGWHASWGGAMRPVSRNPGYYTPAAWPGAAYTWGATASSLPVIAGTVLTSELESGHIDHALAIALPDPRGGQFAWPAQRTDGTGSPAEIPEGARLRLDPRLDLDSLDLPPLTRMLAAAAQRYGMIVRDRTNHAVGLYFEDPTPFPRNPYGLIFHGMTPGQVLAAFPWDRLQVVRMHLCTHAPCMAKTVDQTPGKPAACGSLGRRGHLPRTATGRGDRC